METFLTYFNINTIFFTIGEYQMSYLEFFWTILNILCVWLTSRKKIISWPIGIVATVLYWILFFQIQLYSDLFEQGYFLLTWFVGRYARSNRKQVAAKVQDITRTSTKENVIYIICILAWTLHLSYVTRNLHVWMPAYFEEPASYIYLDAFTTILSFAATILLINKKLEAWYLWILVDIIWIYLYYVKGVKFISLEYVFFLGLATYGLFQWLSLYKKQKAQ